jgi:hypothetical protein
MPRLIMFAFLLSLLNRPEAQQQQHIAGTTMQDVMGGGAGPVRMCPICRQRDVSVSPVF